MGCLLPLGVSRRTIGDASCRGPILLQRAARGMRNSSSAFSLLFLISFRRRVGAIWEGRRVGSGFQLSVLLGEGWELAQLRILVGRAKK